MYRTGTIYFYNTFIILIYNLQIQSLLLLLESSIGFEEELLELVHQVCCLFVAWEIDLK